MTEQKRNLRVLVCGGRDYTDRARVYQILDQLHKRRVIVEIIHGAAKGADTLAEDWARSRQLPYRGRPAQWQQYAKAAGSIRNAEMLVKDTPDVVVAFPGGTGTAHMKQIAAEAGVPVFTVQALP